MNDLLHIGEEGLNLIESFEGFRSRAYYDITGVLTIGYGHTNLDGVSPKVVPGMVISKAQAKEMLRRSVAVVFEKAIKRLVKVPLTQNQFDALVSLVYNIGGSNFAGSSILRYINKGDFKRAANSFVLWNKAKVKGKLVPVTGLTRRRLAEAALFRATPQPLPPSHEDPEVAPEAPVEPEPPVREDAPPQTVEPPKDPIDTVAKVGGAVSPFAVFLAYIQDWKVIAALGAVVIVAGIAGYFIWKNR